MGIIIIMIIATDNATPFCCFVWGAASLGRADMILMMMIFHIIILIFISIIIIISSSNYMFVFTLGFS